MEQQQKKKTEIIRENYCLPCKRQFINKKSLRNHVVLVHEKKKCRTSSWQKKPTHLCSICEKNSCKLLVKDRQSASDFTNFCCFTTTNWLIMPECAIVSCKNSNKLYSLPESPDLRAAWLEKINRLNYGAKYLVLVSSRSLKMRELALLSLYIFWGNFVYFQFLNGRIHNYVKKHNCIFYHSKTEN